MRDEGLKVRVEREESEDSGPAKVDVELDEKMGGWERTQKNVFKKT